MQHLEAQSGITPHHVGLFFVVVVLHQMEFNVEVLPLDLIPPWSFALYQMLLRLPGLALSPSQPRDRGFLIAGFRNFCCCGLFKKEKKKEILCKLEQIYKHRK